MHYFYLSNLSLMDYHSGFLLSISLPAAILNKIMQIAITAL